MSPNSACATSGTRGASADSTLRARSALALALALLLGSCGSRDSGPALLWTDMPELALAAELFNASQARYLVEIQWKANLAEALRSSGRPPALAMGRYLKSSSVRQLFQSLDYLFGELVVNQSSFYPGLLSLGNMEGRQLLLPVSFNLPAIVFARRAEVKNEFLLGLEDMAAPAAAWKQKEKGAYTRMGFSPRWDPDFLALAVNADGAAFREGKPLAWNEQGLRTALDGIKAWVAANNESASLEDDFQFKYLYTPAYQYVSSGRTLFAYIESGSFFLLPEEKRDSLDYRWFARSGSVPVSENIVYAALVRSGDGKQAAEAFLKWFYREDSQRALLESARRTRALEGSFGIAGGFSSVRSVNERVFPLYYPALVGHLPPGDALAAPNVLPSDWPDLKREIVGPWLVEATGKAAGLPADPGAELSARIADWRKNKR